MSVGKVDRNYRLDIFTPDGVQITIAPPFSIKFSVTRNTLASANKGRITLYNLGPGTRNSIFKDRFTITEYWRAQLFAGYGNRLHNVFTGNILEAWSNKELTEWITQIDAFDGLDAIQNGFTAQTVAAGTPRINVIQSIIDDMPNVLAGAFGSPANGEAVRGEVLLGQATDMLSEQTNGQYFIDLETVNILSNDEVIRGQVIVLDESLLLSTPRRREAFLDVSTLFEPQIQVGQIYEIRSLESIYNGQYRVVGFTHDVTISQATSGEARTDIQLYFGAEGLREVS